MLLCLHIIVPGQGAEGMPRPRGRNTFKSCPKPELYGTLGNYIFGHRVHIEVIQSSTWFIDCDVV